jgi:hypothetical protein
MYRMQANVFYRKLKQLCSSTPCSDGGKLGKGVSLSTSAADSLIARFVRESEGMVKLLLVARNRHM